MPRRWMMFVPLLLAVAVVSASASPVLISPTVNNGSFEEGSFVPNCPSMPTGCMNLLPGATDVTHWTIATGAVQWTDAPTFTIAGMNASDGNRWLDLSGMRDVDPHGAVGLTVDLPTAVGAQYLVSFDLGNSSYNRGAVPGLALAIGGQAAVNFFAAGPTGALMDWTTRSHLFIATSTTTALQFSGLGNIGIPVIGLDNVTVTAVPEPSTLLLLVGGLAVAACVRKRRT